MFSEGVSAMFSTSKNRGVAQQEHKQNEIQSSWLGSSLGAVVSSQQALSSLQLPIAPTMVGNNVKATKNKANMLIVNFTL